MKTMRSTTTGLLVALLATTGALVCTGVAAAASPEAPLTEPASEVTGTTATLNGVLNPKVSATTGYFFTYGTEGSCEATATEPGTERTGKAIKVSTPIIGLIPNTTYTFCVVATNKAKEETKGSPLTFKTPPVLALIEEESVSAITQTSASFSAVINPESQETICQGFEYVSEQSFNEHGYEMATTVPCEPENLGSGTSGEPVISTEPLPSELLPNTTYHFRIVAENGSGESEGADHTFLTLPSPPTVTTGGASEITPTSATISGSVDPGSIGPNSDTTYFFEYGPSAGYGSTTAVRDAGEGTSPIAEQASLAGLEPGTYHYRIVATNDTAKTPQTTFGPDETFTTVAVPPVLSAVLVAAVSQGSAVITATLEPRGIATRYELDVGTGSLTAVASGDASVSTSLALSVGSLSPGTTYRYRLSAVNVNDAAEPVYAEGSFATAPLSAEAPLTQPTAPPLLAIPRIAFPGEAPPSGYVVGAKTKLPTNAQKLAKALAVCRRDRSSAKRTACDKAAHRRYAKKTSKRKK
jgi:hypothetical protein